MYLNCHSFHSLRYGTIPVSDLITLGKASGATAMALTDINTVTGIYEFYKSCKESGIKPLVGMELREDNSLLYIALAKNRSGIGEINRHRTKYNLEGLPMTAFAPRFKDVFVIYPMENLPDTLRDFEYIGIREENLSLLIRPEWKGKMDKMVILHPVTFRNKVEHNLHRILRAIDLNTLGSKLTAKDYCSANEIMDTPREYHQTIQSIPKASGEYFFCNQSM